MGHLNSISASGGGNLNKNFAKKYKCPGVARGGMLKLRFDWYISDSIQTSLQRPCRKTPTLRRTGITRICNVTYHGDTLKFVFCFEIKWKLFRSVGFRGGKKTWDGTWRKNFVTRREQTAVNSTHLWRRVLNSNTGPHPRPLPECDFTPPTVFLYLHFIRLTRVKLRAETGS